VAVVGTMVNMAEEDLAREVEVDSVREVELGPVREVELGPVREVVIRVRDVEEDLVEEVEEALEDGMEVLRRGVVPPNRGGELRRRPPSNGNDRGAGSGNVSRGNRGRANPTGSEGGKAGAHTRRPVNGGQRHGKGHHRGTDNSQKSKLLTSRSNVVAAFCKVSSFLASPVVDL